MKTSCQSDKTPSHASDIGIKYIIMQERAQMMRVNRRESINYAIMRAYLNDVFILNW